MIRRISPAKRARDSSFSISSISSFEDDRTINRNMVRRDSQPQPQFTRSIRDESSGRNRGMLRGRSREMRDRRDRSRGRMRSRENVREDRVDKRDQGTKHKEIHKHRRHGRKNSEENYFNQQREAEREIIIHHNTLADESVSDPSAVNFRASFKPVDYEEHKERPKSQDTQYRSEVTSRIGKVENPVDRIGRLEKLVEILVTNNAKSKPQSTKSYETAEVVSPNVIDIPELIPSNTRFTTSMWLNRVHEECLERNFDEQTSLEFLQSRMTGIVKAWFKTVSSYDFTWPELRLLITKTFPDNSDFATTLKLLVNRERISEETITQYYFSKLYLCEACKITGENAVSCLIDGLNNPFMKQDIKVQNFLTPEVLYSHYLSKFPENESNYVSREGEREVIEDYDMDEVHIIEPDRDYRMPPAPPSFKSDKAKRCYTCNKVGHLTVNCRHAPLCYNCNKKGHIAAKCHFRNKTDMMLLSSNHDKVISYSSIDCEVNNCLVKAIIDTGSTMVTLRQSFAKHLGLKLQSSNKILHGYGGGSVKALGEVEVNIKLGDVQDSLPAVVVPDYVQIDALIIGQPLLSKEDVAIVFKHNRVQIFQLGNI